MTFLDRDDAGTQLARALVGYRDQDVVVLGLPRGGVPVAARVAEALGAPLDVLVVRKLGLPFQPELAMGAIGEGGVRVLNEDVVHTSHLSHAEFEAVEAAERAELDRRARRFRDDHPREPLQGRTAIVVDDGIATGATARAACLLAREHGAQRVVLAVPIGSSHTVDDLRSVADEVVCLEMPHWFYAVGQGYRNFEQVSDAEVVAMLERAWGAFAPVAKADPSSVVHARDEDVEVLAGDVRLSGHLTVPEEPRGLVVFVHGSGSSRLSPRNRYVAQVLNEAGLGTLLFDLLTWSEERNRAMVFDIDLLAHRLSEVTAWLRAEPGYADVPIGYFGASTGAAAALAAVAEGEEVGAVVSRGGRPDLAGERLRRVPCPTRLIVGGDDTVVLDLNRRAQALLPVENDLVVVPGATHLFEEPGTLALAAGHARDWFLTHLGRVEALSGRTR